MARSHGHRSSSVRGWPEDILAMLASGWNPSPSANSQPIAVAIPCATVVLPDPDTPITMMMSFMRKPYARARRSKPRRRGGASVGQWLEAADGGDDLFGHQLKRMKGAGADDCAVGDLHAQLRERAQVFDCLGYPLAPLPEVESGLHRLLDLGVVAPLCRAVFA